MLSEIDRLAGWLLDEVEAVTVIAEDRHQIGRRSEDSAPGQGRGRRSLDAPSGARPVRARAPAARTHRLLAEALHRRPPRRALRGGRRIDNPRSKRQSRGTCEGSLGLLPSDLTRFGISQRRGETSLTAFRACVTGGVGPECTSLEQVAVRPSVDAEKRRRDGDDDAAPRPCEQRGGESAPGPGYGPRPRLEGVPGTARELHLRRAAGVAVCRSARP